MGRALYNLFEFLEQYKIVRCSKAGDLKTGDIVVCWTNKTATCLGKVVDSGHTDLIHDHEDGPYGEVFVLPYFKGRVKAGTPYNTQSGWWMFNEVSLLPRKNEHFSKNEIARSVIYTGHKPTTRREQIQENWTIEIADLEDVAKEDEVVDVQGSPRRRSPRKSGKSGRTTGRRRIFSCGGKRPVGTRAKAAAKAQDVNSSKAAAKAPDETPAKAAAKPLTKLLQKLQNRKKKN